CPLPLLEPLPSTVASTSGGGIVALAFELDDLGLLLFMLFSKRWTILHVSHRHACYRSRNFRWFAPMWRERRTLETAKPTLVLDPLPLDTTNKGGPPYSVCCIEAPWL